MMAWIPMQSQQQNQNQNQLQLQQHQPSASQFHLFPLIEGLASTVEGGVRDQNSDILVNELTAQFEKCQQLLNALAGPNDTVTVRGQKQKLEEYEKQLNNRRDLIMKYKSIVENYVGSS